MTQVWRSTPQFKLEISGETYINDEALWICNVRPENNISYLTLLVNDYQSSKYVDVFDTFDAIDLSLRYGTDSWTKTFGGRVAPVSPQLSMQGEVLEAGAWGKGEALIATGCDESYGVESRANQTLDTPKEIIDDLITNHINKLYGGAASGWSIGNKVDNAHAGLSITYLDSPYYDNFVNVNRVCDLASAYAAGVAQVGTHWYIDPTPNFYFKKIDADHSDGAGVWDQYWGGTMGTSPGTQASSTIVVKEDMILYDFKKNPDQYANVVVLTSLFRKPSEDLWCEYRGAGADTGSHLWGSDANCDLTDENGAGLYVVGGYSLCATPNDANPSTFYYPAGKDAAWDLTKIGSEVTASYISFYFRQTRTPTFVTHIYLCTNAADFWEIMSLRSGSPFQEINEWVHITFPVGPYHGLFLDEAGNEWTKNANADWADIDYIEFGLAGASSGEHCYIDDLHFTGTVVREAQDAAEIAAHNVKIKPLRNDTAVNDTLIAATDTGTAARLAYAELLRRVETPLVGMIQIPLAPTLLPGQTIHVHACEQASGTYRVNMDMRVKELRHVIGKGAPHGGFCTILNLTSDVTNSHAFGAPDRYSLLREHAGALGHGQARDLKGSAVDNRIPRLTKSY